MDIYFISSNAAKRREVMELLCSETISVRPVNLKLNELQSVDMAKIAEEKAISGFKEVWRPVLVEQTGLLLTGFGDLPGGFTQIFWDTLGADPFSQFFSSLASGEAVAKSVFAYCDGRQIQTFEGQTKGRVVAPPRGRRESGWDCVFQPEGETRTFAELPPGEKEKFSIRKAALEQVRIYLEGGTARGRAAGTTS